MNPSVWSLVGALWLALVLLCGGCASPRHRANPPTNLAEVAVHLSTAADRTCPAPAIELTLQTVVILQEAGPWGRGSYWDEYVTTITGHGTVPVTVETAELIDGEGKSVVPGDNPWTLANRRKPWFEQTDRHGVTNAGRIGVGAVAVGALGPPLVSVGLYAPCLLTWGTYGAAAAVIAPFYAAKAVEFNVKGRKQVEADFNRCRLALPVPVAPGQVLQGSWGDGLDLTVNARAGFRAGSHVSGTQSKTLCHCAHAVCRNTGEPGDRTMKTRRLKLFCLLLETAGIVALFLPFAYDLSPWRVLVNTVRSELFALWPYALPAFVAVLVWMETLRSLSQRPSGKSELRFYTLLAGLLTLVPLGFWPWTLVSGGGGLELADWIFLALLFGLTLFAAGLLAILKRKGISFQVLAPLLLRCAYVPNAVACLVYFSRFPLQRGAALVAVTVVLYLAEVVDFTRRGWRARPVAAAPAQTG